MGPGPSRARAHGPGPMAQDLRSSGTPRSQGGPPAGSHRARARARWIGGPDALFLRGLPVSWAWAQETPERYPIFIRYPRAARGCSARAAHRREHTSARPSAQKRACPGEFTGLSPGLRRYTPCTARCVAACSRVVGCTQGGVPW